MIKYLRRKDGSVWAFSEALAARDDMQTFEVECPSHVPDHIPDLAAFMVALLPPAADTEPVRRTRRKVALA